MGVGVCGDVWVWECKVLEVHVGKNYIARKVCYMAPKAPLDVAEKL